MDIYSAVKTGRKIRRKMDIAVYGEREWFDPLKPEGIVMCQEDLLATDWEAEPAPEKDHTKEAAEAFNTWYKDVESGKLCGPCNVEPIEGSLDCNTALCAEIKTGKIKKCECGHEHDEVVDVFTAAQIPLRCAFQAGVQTGLKLAKGA